MNLLKLNKRQAIFCILFVIVLVLILGYITALYSKTTLYVPLIGVLSAFGGSLIAKKIIK